MIRVYRLKELRFLANKLLVILIVVYVSIKQLLLSLCKKCFLTYYNIRLTSFYSTYDVTRIKWLFCFMINLTSIHSFNIYGRIVSKSWKKMLLILVEYQKFCLPNRERYCTQSYITHFYFFYFIYFILFYLPHHNYKKYRKRRKKEVARRPNRNYRSLWEVRPPRTMS